MIYLILYIDEKRKSTRQVLRWYGSYEVALEKWAKIIARPTVARARLCAAYDTRITKPYQSYERGKRVRRDGK